MAFGSFAGAMAGGTIGAVAVQLIADSSKLNAGLTSAKKNTASAATSMERRAANLKAAWTGMAIVAGAALIKLGISAVKSAREAEVAQANLINTLEKMPKLSGANIQAFNDQAAAIQDYSGVSDEAITIAQSMLGTFGLTKQQLLEATPVVVDYAEKFGVDLKSAAIQVGKAFDGNIGALKRNGISLDEVAFKADPVKEVFRAIREQAGGFAEQQGKTFSKRVEILKHNFDDLKESIGRLLLNALEPTVKVISALVDGFGNLPGPVKATIGAFGGLLAVSIVLGPAIGRIITAVKVLGPLLVAFATGPLAIVVAALILAKPVIDAFHKKFGTIGEQIANALPPEFYNALTQALRETSGAIDAVSRSGGDAAKSSEAFLRAQEKIAQAAKQATAHLKNQDSILGNLADRYNNFPSLVIGGPTGGGGGKGGGGGVLPTHHMGGPINRTGPAMLQQGEFVLSRSMVAALSGPPARGGDINISIDVHGDIHGDEFARKVEMALSRSISRFAGV